MSKDEDLIQFMLDKMGKSLEIEQLPPKEYSLLFKEKIIQLNKEYSGSSKSELIEKLTHMNLENNHLKNFINSISLAYRFEQVFMNESDNKKLQGAYKVRNFLHNHFQSKLKIPFFNAFLKTSEKTKSVNAGLGREARDKKYGYAEDNEMIEIMLDKNKHILTKRKGYTNLAEEILSKCIAIKDVKTIQKRITELKKKHNIKIK